MAEASFTVHRVPMPRSALNVPLLRRCPSCFHKHPMPRSQTVTFSYPRLIKTLLLISGTGLQTMTFAYPLNQNATFNLDHGVPDRDFFIPLPIKTQLSNSCTGLHLDLFTSHLNRSATFHLDHGVPDCDFLIPL